LSSVLYVKDMSLVSRFIAQEPVMPSHHDDEFPPKVPHCGS
jgi:hypothetical protein